MSHIQRLQTDLNIPLVKLLGWWGAIDTAWYDIEGMPKTQSLYDKLFQNKTVLGSEGELEKLALTQAHKEKLGDHIPTLLAILGISDADLVTLKTATGLDDSSFLTLENLSRLYRFTHFVKTLRLSLPDFLILRTLTGIDPFESASHPENIPSSPSHTENTLLFIEKVNKIHASGFSVAQLTYLYLHLFEPTGNLSPTAANLNGLAKDLLVGLNKIASETAPSTPSQDIFQRQLALILDNQLVNEAIAFLDRISRDIHNNIFTNTPANQNLLALYFGLFLPLNNKTYSTLLEVTIPNNDIESIPNNSNEVLYKGELTDKQEAIEQFYKLRAFSYLLSYLLPYVLSITHKLLGHLQGLGSSSKLRTFK